MIVLKFAFLLAYLTFPKMSLAQSSLPAPQSAAQFCAQLADERNFQRLLATYENQLGFVNDGGLGDGGVCWWHSRYTRAAALTTFFRPDLAKPSLKEAKSLIEKIRSRKQVVMIPGYRNLREFSFAHRDLVQKELNQWQVADSAGFQWWRGLRGKTKVSADKLQEMMDELFDQVVYQKEAVVQILQMKGVVAHAWIVLNMLKTSDGYSLLVHDSNFAGTSVWQYKKGMTNFDYSSFGPFVPYSQKKYSKEQDSLLLVASNFCQ